MSEEMNKKETKENEYCPQCAKNGKQNKGQYWAVDVSGATVLECPVCHFLFRKNGKSIKGY